jgi:hypothetical protein
MALSKKKLLDLVIPGSWTSDYKPNIAGVTLSLDTHLKKKISYNKIDKINA